MINVIISTEYNINNLVIYLDQPKLYQAFIDKSRELRVRDLSGYGKGQIINGIERTCTAGFWVRQQGVAYLTTVGHGIKQHFRAVRFFFVIPNTGPDHQTEFFGDMIRFDVTTVDKGYILPFDDNFVESPFIYNKKFPRAPLFAIADFTRTPDRSIAGLFYVNLVLKQVLHVVM
ncbi:hypothetical protein F8M41_000204 [Gigaspora margarita]|uniref:Uncharacterized protein n=1 Tax=Gigaspora margarita TaxID=4874 RepID=A0A8H3XGE8_GIGMA|nr:hypothetical protein F8M41_000204 [Gigaspora margarita]